MTEGPDPERLLAEALRAQVASTPVPPPSPLPIDESPAEPLAPLPPASLPPASLGSGQPPSAPPQSAPPVSGDAADGVTNGSVPGSVVPDSRPDSGSDGALGDRAEPSTDGPGSDARLVELLSGAGHGLLSGRDPNTASVPYLGVPTDRTGPVNTTKLSPGRPQLAWWWMLLLAIALGLACGAIAGILTLV